MSRRRCPEKNPLLQLLEPDVSLERAWAEISIAHVRDRAAVSTVEALMFALRSSVHALGRPDTLRRLAALGDAIAAQAAIARTSMDLFIASPPGRVGEHSDRFPWAP